MEISKSRQRKVEETSLKVCAAVNLLMALAGIWVYSVTRIQALFLDGFFSLIGFTANIFAIVISRVSKKRTKAYPDGLYFFEPLYAILKSVLTLGLLIASVIGTAKVAYRYFSFGEGEPMNIAPVVPYVIAMLLLCFGLGFFNILQNKRISNVSTMLTAESRSNIIDGVLSGGCGLGVLLLYFIPIDGALGFLHYTGDFFITVILVIFSLSQPIKVLISSFKELSGGKTNDRKITETVGQTVGTIMKPLTSEYICHIFKIGMFIRIRLEISFEFASKGAEVLQSVRNSIKRDLQKDYDNVDVWILFTEEARQSL